MSDVSKLLERIDGTITTAREKVQEHNRTLAQDYAERQKRLQAFEQTRDQVRQIAKPRLEALVRRFGSQVEVTPKLSQTRAAAALDFQSSAAFITLTFSVVPDQEIRNIVVEYDLDVTPVLTAFESHAEFRAPIGGLDAAALEAWLDEWIVKFVVFYVHLHESEAFARADHVEDPMAHVKFPKFAAAATLEHEGKTYYFVSRQTRDDFARGRGIATS
jgi:YHS domain-containing protein